MALLSFESSEWQEHWKNAGRAETSVALQQQTSVSSRQRSETDLYNSKYCDTNKSLQNMSYSVYKVK